MRKTHLLLIGLFLPFLSISQQYVNDNGYQEKKFLFEVKQIDEFFERFNDSKNSFLRRTLEKQKTRFALTRSKLLQSLLNNADTTVWRKKGAADFFSSITNAAHPQYLSFFTGNWYAEAQCRFHSNGSVFDIPLILKINYTENGGSKWMICGVRPGGNLKQAVCQPPQQEKNLSNYISPASHTTDFAMLKNVFENRSDFFDYIDDSFFNSKVACTFFSAVQDGKLQFDYVKNIKYHFLQVDNWIFTVENFKRNSFNSGWLISNLAKATDEQKKVYLQRLLGY